MTKLTAEDVIRDGDSNRDWEDEGRDNHVGEEFTDDFFAGRDPLITLKYTGCGTGLCALVGAGFVAWGGYELAESINEAFSVSNDFVRAYAGTCYTAAGFVVGGVAGALAGFFGGYMVGCSVEERKK